MNLKELIQTRERMLSYPEEWKEENQNVFRCLEDRIASERAKLNADEDDPALNAKIEEWISEGRIHTGFSMGAFAQ